MKSKWLFLVCFVGAGAIGPPVHGVELRVGETFPTISLPSLDDGRPMSVRDFRGKKLVLNIWASW
jgi:hypothetical protein